MPMLDQFSMPIDIQIVFLIHRPSPSGLIRRKIFFEYLIAKAIFYLQLAIFPSVLIE
jgi:hypothetical protein